MKNVDTILYISGDLSRAGDQLFRGQQQPGGGGHRVQSGPAPAWPQLQVRDWRLWRELTQCYNFTALPWRPLATTWSPSPYPSIRQPVSRSDTCAYYRILSRSNGIVLIAQVQILSKLDSIDN